MAKIWGLIKREMTMALRSGGDMLSVVLFFIITVSLFPLAMTPTSSTLRLIAPAILWLCALLSLMLSMENIFARDYEDGTLDQLLHVGLPWMWVVGAKLISFWLLTSLPLLCVTPLLAMMLNVPSSIMGLLLGVLCIGTIIFTLTGTMGSALVLQARYRGVLLPLIVLPLTIPPLIFGTSALHCAIQGVNYSADIEFLLAFCFFFLPVCLWGAVCGLRNAADG